MYWLSRLERWFVQLNQALIVALMATMTALVFVNVVARYGFGVSYGWAVELSRFAMIWVTFLGAGLALRYGQLVSVDVLQTALPPAGRRFLRWVVALLVLAFLLALLWLGILFVAFSWQNQTPVLRWPKGIPYLAVPLGAGFLILHLLLIWRRFVSATFEPLVDLEADAGESPGGARGEHAR